MRRKAQQEQCDALREQEKRTCEFCGVEFSRHKGEGRKVFNVRQTCGKECAERLRKQRKQEEVVQEKKKCEVCGTEFTRRPRSETKAKFRKRKTCGTTCGRRSRLESHSWGVKERQPEKPRSTLEPVAPLSREIPDAPPSPAQPVWRPKAYGWPEDGPLVKVS